MKPNGTRLHLYKQHGFYRFGITSIKIRATCIRLIRVPFCILINFQMKKNILILLLFLPIFSFSQTIKVIDSQTFRGLEGVVVKSDNKPLGITNFEGIIKPFSTKDSLEIELTAQGYIAQKIWFFSTKNLQILLEPSTFELNEVIVKSYESGRKLSETPASVAVLKRIDLERFSNNSLVPAVNTLAGVRMEERSPGSYRLSIRGSTLRSPFGVRNVKIYWNDLPMTDPAGNTYLNQLDFSNIGRIEILKGPSGSLYGAGTGGVVLLESQKAKSGNEIASSLLTGSYGLLNYGFSVKSASEKQNTFLNYAVSKADGYREQSAMKRESLSWQSHFFIDEKRSIAAQFLYSDLYYQTPGGLTFAQTQANPQQARPKAGTFQSAIDQKAAIYLKTFWLGLTQEYLFGKNWKNQTGIYLSQTRAENPSIRNFERRIEPSFGGRTTTNYRFADSFLKGTLHFGAEYQSGFFTNKTYGNRKGNVDTLQTDDEIKSNQLLLFGQIDLDLSNTWFVTLGGSYNQLNTRFVRLGKNAQEYERAFEPVFAPRIAILKKMGEYLAFHGSIASGFSPPTVAEIRPSEGSFNTTLNPEKGTNLEIGMRGKAFKQKLYFDITAFQFLLKETIVLRRTADGADYFQNAGNTNQQGLEMSFSYQISSNLKTFLNYTYHDFKFAEYVVNKTDFSGNKLTGTPPQILNYGIDYASKSGLYANLTYHFTDKIYLNDANTDYASGYRLLHTKLGFRKNWKHFNTDFFAGIDNALNEKYSLGNDLNATGNRFYNPAAERNFYGGMKLGWRF
jgi:iron complex outermembrane recepter protein